MLLHYRELGTGEPLVVLHGLYGSGENWLSIARELSMRYRVILVDLRNHGGSFHSPSMGYPEMADDLHSLLQEIGLSKINLLGHSMGGKVAMQYAKLGLRRIRRLVVVDISPFDECTRSDIAGAHGQIISGLEAVPIGNLTSRNQADAVLAGFIPETRVRQFLLKNLKRDGNSFRWALNIGAIRTNMSRIMSGVFEEGEVVHTQTLFVRGERSNYISEHCAGMLPSAFSNFRLVTIPQAGHWLHAEQPQLFISLTLNFLQGKNY